MQSRRTQPVAQITGDGCRQQDVPLGFHEHQQTARDGTFLTGRCKHRSLHLHQSFGFKLRFAKKAEQGNDQSDWQSS